MQIRMPCWSTADTSKLVQYFISISSSPSWFSIYLLFYPFPLLILFLFYKKYHLFSFFMKLLYGMEAKCLV